MCWMTVPLSWRGLWRQRLRWARGLAQVLRKHADVLVTWNCRRLWPVFIESSLSILWSVCFVFLAALWTLSYAVGLPPVGASPIPNLWGMAIATLCLLQLLTGVLIDRRYDPRHRALPALCRVVPDRLLGLPGADHGARLALPAEGAGPGEAVRWTTARTGSAS
jgi:biofilm PGA synthesis N-glycosyltransferase PgaC